MKGILSLIIFVSFGFAQDVLIANSGTEYRGEFINKTDNSISFKAERMLNAQKIDIKNIGSLILADGTVVIKNSYFIEDDVKKYGKEEMKKIQQSAGKRKSHAEIGKKESVNETAISLSTIGGALIGVSGILLYTNNQKTLDDNATLGEVEEFMDEYKSNVDLSYILLAIGGFLIAIGNG